MNALTDSTRSTGPQMGGRPLSIIVPAHRERDVIGACLRSIAAQDHAGPVTIVVAANGSYDGTAEAAEAERETLRRSGAELVVLDLPEASKPAALNAADAVAPAGDRVYLDADAELSPNALQAIVAAFDDGAWFCAPTIVPIAADRFGKLYGDVWTQLPYVAEDAIGAGVYAVRGDGRERWGTFPAIVADDKYARLHFAPAERRVIAEAAFHMHLPVGFRELVRVRSRWIRANRELRREFPHIAARDRRYGTLLRFLVSRRDLWARFPAFLMIYACAELRSLTRSERWERAAGSRIARGGAESAGAR